MRDHATLRSRIGTEILILAKSFQSGRVPDFGTNVPKNERSVTRSKIGTQILILAKTFQEGRVPNFGTNVPKNEGVIWKPFPDTLLPNAATVNLFRPVTKMVISISETSTFARQAAYTPPAGRDSALIRIFTLAANN